MYRNTIYVEDAEILSQRQFPGDQFILRVAAPKCARTAKPGAFAHLQCDPLLPMRRPLSIMRVSTRQGWIEFLYKISGQGTRMLALRCAGETINLLGPIGRPFTVNSEHPRPLLIGGGVGIPPMIFLAETITAGNETIDPLVLAGSELPFPFAVADTAEFIAGLPGDAIASLQDLDQRGIKNRLASLQGYPGCHNGYVTDMARAWLSSLRDEERAEVAIFACGPQPMLAQVARLAREFGLPGQVSLEEYMACAVGGCAGCVVKVMTPHGEAMKRVCVDGPVFSADELFYALS